MALPLDRDDRHRFLERVDPVIVLDEHHFEAALTRATDVRTDLDSVGPAPADTATRLRAARLAGAANDPATLGLIAQYREDRDTSFSGSVFVVVREPVVDRDTKMLQATDFKVVAVRLSGTAPWVGTAVGLAVDTAVVGEPGRCCGREVVCREDLGGPPGPGPEPGPLLGLPVPSVGDSVGISRVRPASESIRAELGLRAIQLVLYGPGDFGTGGQPRPMPHVCTRVIAPGCEVRKPVCGPDDVGYTLDEAGSGGEEGSGSSLCGSRTGGPATGHDVPKICQHISGWETLPPECGGYCPSCANPWGDRTGLPDMCAAMKVAPGAEAPQCKPKTPAELYLENEQYKLEFGYFGAAGTRCTPTGRDGIEVCITCDSDGNCAKGARKPPFDPTVATEPPPDDDSPAPDGAGLDADPITGFTIVETGSGGPTAAPVPLGGVGGSKPDNAPKGPAPAAPPATPRDPAGPLGPGKDPTTPTPAHPQPGPTVSEMVSARPKTPEVMPKAPPGKRVGDPIDQGSGALVLEHLDLSFPGPARRLEFARVYNSVSRERSPLGSNWRHNWDVYLRPLTSATLPEYLSLWCAGSPDQTTAVMLHDGLDGPELYLLDISTRLFLPQAGGVGTLRQTTTGGWALRDPDGRIRIFNADGYLVSDRDRFGSGFALEYEATPLWPLYNRLVGAVAPGESEPWKRHPALAYLVGEARRPQPPTMPDNWTADDWRDVATWLQLARDPAMRYPLDYLRHLIGLGGGRVPADPVDGGRRLRVKRVTDDLGRSLVFEYYATPETSGGWAHEQHPQVGLLRSVRGPAVTSVTFTYERPDDYPAELNEQFLVLAKRFDDTESEVGVVAAADRNYSFTYNWPGGNYDQRPPSYDRYRDDVFSAYLPYFTTFTGCWYSALELCGDGTASVGAPRFADGDPQLLAKQAANAYVSDVADDIIAVAINDDIECETRYQIDPWQVDSHRVVAQRYGSTTAQQNPLRTPPDGSEDHWLTTLPKAVFEYVPAGPSESGQDGTEAWLPAPLRARYALEPPRQALVGQPDPGPVVPARGPLDPACDYAAMALAATKLPGWGPSFAYYDAPGPAPRPHAAHALRRTRLTPEQLQGNQVGDPASNDLVSTLAPDPTGGAGLVVERMLGGRSRLSANLNRICAWLRVTDRDSDVQYVGLNYRGQSLVTALEGGDGHYTVSEVLVNADGNTIEQRRPVRTPQAWSPADGYTAFQYQEVNPAGNRGWNDWLPAFWARRANLILVEERAPSPGVLDDDEAGQLVTSIGRYRRLFFEPLFNQMLGTEEGSLEQREADDASAAVVGIGHRSERRILDYQELSLKVPPDSDSSLEPVLADLEGWGFHWARNADGTLDTAVIESWQLPLELFGADLNGDNATGHRFLNRPADRAKALPVIITHGRPGSTDAQLTYLRWSTHGRPTWVQHPDREWETFSYYPVSTNRLGPHGPGGSRPGESEGPGRRGMLASHTRSRFLGGYPDSFGPLGQLPCEALRGPYQWLLPQATSAETVADALKTLGLAAEAVDDILALSNLRANDRTSNIRYAYAVTGHVRRIVTDTGTEHITSDPGGRPRRIVDSAGTRTEIDYDARGNTVAIRAYAPTGDQVSETRRRYDVADQLLEETSALEPAAFDTPPRGRRVATRFTYTGEEQLREIVDPAGTVTTFRYDSTKLLSGAVRTAAAGNATRSVALHRDASGRVVEVRHGAPPTVTLDYWSRGLPTTVSVGQPARSRHEASFGNTSGRNATCRSAPGAATLRTGSRRPCSLHGRWRSSTTTLNGQSRGKRTAPRFGASPIRSVGGSFATKGSDGTRRYSFRMPTAPRCARFNPTGPLGSTTHRAKPHRHSSALRGRGATEVMRL